MKQKNIIILFLVGMISIIICLLVFSYFKFVQSHNQFPDDGFTLKIIESENGTVVSPVYFTENTSYQSFFPNMIKFKNTDGNKESISINSYLHLADGSIAILSEGVLVDFTQARLGYIDHYSISPNTKLINEGNSKYVPEGRSDIFESGNFLFKLQSDNYLFAADEIVITTPIGEEIILKDFVEFMFPKEGIICLMGMDESMMFTTSGTNLYRKNDESTIISFTDMTVHTNTGTTLCLDDIDVYGENNLSVDAAMRIPYYDIEAQDGRNGVQGNEGAIGIIGITGDAGMVGESGEEGALGATGSLGEDGVAGAKGSRGPKGTNGENLMDGDSNDILPIASFTDFSITKDSVSAQIKFNNYNGLKGSVQANLYNASSGELVNSDPMIAVGANVGAINISFTGLNNGTRYDLIISGEYQFDESGVNGTAIFLSREFTTNDFGVSSNIYYVDNDEVGIQIHNKAESNVVRVSIKDINGITVESEEISCNQETTSQKLFSNLLSNSEYMITIEYYEDSTDSYVWLEQLNTNTNKKAPSGIEAITVATNVLSGKFELAMTGEIMDEDNAIISYNYELFDMDGNMCKVISSSNTLPISLYPDNQVIFEGITYCVRGRVDYYDNEKTVSIRTPFSENVVMIIPNVTVNTEFTLVSAGTNYIQMVIKATPVNTTIVADDMHLVTVALSSPEYGAYTFNSENTNDDGTVTYELYQTNLYPDMNYIVTISGYTDNLGDGTLSYNEWGSTTIKTSE